MKVVILAGGLGTRFGKMTEVIPKPMVTVGGKPILWHIMNIYATRGFKDFVIALGYKSKIIKQFFFNNSLPNKDSINDLNSKIIKLQNFNQTDWKVTLVETGIDTMTGGRLRRLKEYLEKETFMLTYGDGVADINVSTLLKFHVSHGKMVSVTAVHPAARFGELEIVGQEVRSFKEKPQINQGWINGGFFVIEPEFLELIDNDSTVLEGEPLEEVARRGELKAFLHEGFWQCMDTPRDRNNLELIWNENNAPWKIW